MEQGERDFFSDLHCHEPIEESRFRGDILQYLREAVDLKHV